MSLKLTEAQLRAKIKRHEKTIAQQKADHLALMSLYKRLRRKSAEQQALIDEQHNALQKCKPVDNSRKRIPFKL